jgi:hypothetical protein
VSRVTLVTVPAMTLGDLLLWHWSLAGNHDVLALASGLTLPPLLVATAWLLVVTLVRLLARGARGPFARLSRQRAADVAAVTTEPSAVASAHPEARAAQIATPAVAPAGRDASSRKIAA